MTVPDKWVILKLTEKNSDESVYKVFASFYGGYLDGDSCKINSGIESIEIEEYNTEKESFKLVKFKGYSGSIYECNLKESSYGTSLYGGGVMQNIINKAAEAEHSVEVLSFETDWIKLLN